MKVVIPKESVSDDNYKITEIVYENGEQVSEGDILGSFETSKADFDIEAEQDGYVYTNYKVGETISVGDVFFFIFEEPTPDEEFIQQKATLSEATSQKEVSGASISKKAMALIEKEGIDPGVFTGKRLIKEKDVHDWIAANKELDTSLLQDQYNENDVVIFGAGGHGGMCIDIVQAAGDLNIVGLLDGDRTKKTYMGYQVLGPEALIPTLVERGLKKLIIGIGFVGNLPKRQKMYFRMKDYGLELPSVIHPNALIEPSAVLGEGLQVMAGAVIGSNARVEDNCIVNCNSVVSHDCIIGHSTHITPGAVLAGHITIGERCTIGMASTAYIGVKIADDCTLSNGVHVFKDLEKGTLVNH